MLSSGFEVVSACIPCVRQALPVGKQGEAWEMEEEKPSWTTASVFTVPLL